MQTTLNRRTLVRLAGGTALAAIPALGAARRAEAGRVWCRLDPVFRVDGLIGNVYVSGLVDRTYDVTGPTQLGFIVPEGVQAELLSSDNGFGHGYAITQATSSQLRNEADRIEIGIAVYVPAGRNDLPVLVEFVPDGSIKVADHQDGTTNKLITVKTELRKPKPVTSGKSK